MIVKDLSKEFHPVPKPKKVESTKTQSKINQKSNKLAKLERKRYSILTSNMKKCYLCGKKKKHIHEIYKGSNRQISMKYGFCVPICEECHSETEINADLDKGLKKECQQQYEKIHTREEFRTLIGKSYL